MADPDPSTVTPACQCWPRRIDRAGSFGSSMLICTQCGREIREPLRYFKVSTESVVRRRHERTIVARTEAEALAEYERGTAWPSDYDTRRLETIECKPTVVGEVDHPELRGDPNDPAEFMHMQTYLARAIKSEYPWPDTPSKEIAEFLSRSGDSE